MLEKLGITPGPWAVVACDYDWDDDGEPKNVPVGIVNKKIKRAVISSDEGNLWPEGIPLVETQNNFRLIAAAPEMLEALVISQYLVEAMLTVSKEPLSTPEDIKKINPEFAPIWKIKSAIEKATGKSWEEIKRLQEE